MKQGRKYLYSNGRGNYQPVSLTERNYLKKIKKRLAKHDYTTDRQKECMESYINASRHGIGLRQLRKGLNSKLRHLAKNEIKNMLNENYAV